MVRGNLSYDGTDIPPQMRAKIYHRDAQKAIQTRFDRVHIAGYGFWHDMYKKRFKKYMQLRNSLIEVNTNYESDNPFDLNTEENKVMKEIYTYLFRYGMSSNLTSLGIT